MSETLDSASFSLREYNAFIKAMYANTHVGFVAIGAIVMGCISNSFMLSIFRRAALSVLWHFPRVPEDTRRKEERENALHGVGIHFGLLIHRPRGGGLD